MMRNSDQRVLVVTSVCLGVGLLLSGCSAATGTSSSPSGSRQTTANATVAPQQAASAPASACSLITEQDAATALGSDPGPGTETTNYGATSCVFGQYPQMITVNLAPAAGRAGYDRLDKPPTVGTLVTLNGIGDAAFGVLNPPVATVEFLRGNAVVAIVVVADGSEDRAVTLATAAAGRF